MAKLIIPLLLILISRITNSYAQTCSTYTFATNKLYASCKDLPFLNSFLHWNYNSSTSNLQIAFRQTGINSSYPQWAAWAINPTSTGMVGSQALIAYPAFDGTVRAYTSPIAAYRTVLDEAKLSFDVSELSATYGNDEIVIYATLVVSERVINQVWQQGLVVAGRPAMHPNSGPNVESMGRIDLLSGTVHAGGGSDRLAKRHSHGLLNTMSWGIMMPIGALTARYMKAIAPGNTAWFYLHVSCQSIAYIIGVIGWGTGLRLGSESPGVQHTVHRNIGITVFVLGTLQVLALLLRPKPEHKYRFYWNIYHHSVGYSVIVLSAVNILRGLGILHPGQKWKDMYVAIVVVLATCAAFLEGVKWYLVKRRNSEEKLSRSYGSTA